MPGCQVPAAPRSSGDDAAALFPRPTAAHRVQVPPPSSRAQPCRMKRAGLARSSASAPQCLPASAATQQPADPVPLSLRPAHCHRADVNSGFFPVTLLPTLPNPSIPLSAPVASSTPRPSRPSRRPHDTTQPLVRPSGIPFTTPRHPRKTPPWALSPRQPRQPPKRQTPASTTPTTARHRSPTKTPPSPARGRTRCGRSPAHRSRADNETDWSPPSL